MRILFTLNCAAIVAVTLICSSFAYDSARGERQLTIGSIAPELEISDWIQRGLDDKAPKVSKFEKGKIYVVEFWATWCGPCIQSMPHLAQLQEEYEGKGVRIISVTEEDVDTVNEFLEKETKGKDGKSRTFDEITQPYTLTADPDGSTHRDYPSAAEQSGIPVAFIVGTDAKIDWIGHPGEMDEPLKRIVERTWDRKAFAEVFEEEKAYEKLQEKISAKLGSTGRDPSTKQVDAVIKMLEDFTATAKTEKVREKSEFMDLQIRMQFQPNDPPTFESYKRVAKKFESRPSQLNALNWGVYELTQSEHLTNKDLISDAVDRTLAIIDKVPKNQRGSVLDTVSHLQFELGDYKAALQSAKLAAAEPDALPEFKTFVEKIEQKIESGVSDSK